MKLTAHPLAELPPGESRATALNQQLILRLRVSLAELVAHGDRLAETFYDLLFARHPELRQLFPAHLDDQQKKLTETLVWVVMHLDQRDALIPAVRALGRRHAGYGVTPNHYVLVSETMIDAMRQIAGYAWSAQLTEDWRVSLDLIAHHMQSSTSTTPR